VLGDTVNESTKFKSSFFATFLSIANLNTLNQFEIEIGEVTLALYDWTLHSYIDFPLSENIFPAEIQFESVTSDDTIQALSLFPTFTQSNTVDFSVLLYSCTKYPVAFDTLA
jgi:hypothetical protein